MIIAYHLKKKEWREIVNLEDYELLILKTIEKFSDITGYLVKKRYFMINIDVDTYKAKRKVIRRFFKELAKTKLSAYGEIQSGIFRLFIEKKPKKSDDK